MNFAILRITATALMLAFALSALPAANALAQNTPVHTVQFDGKALYQAAFEQIRDKHFKLIETQDRELWVNEWEHKFTDDQLVTEAAADAAIASMLSSLKMRFDRYLGNDYVQVKEALSGASASVGIVLKERFVQQFGGPAREIYIERLLPGSPAYGVLQPGDVLTTVGCKVDSDSDKSGCRTVASLSDRDVELALYGKDGSSAVLCIARGEMADRHDLRVVVSRKDMTRQAVFVDRSRGDAAVISVTSFLPADFQQQFESALKQAVGAKRIIIDLRGNPGGRTDVAVLAVGNLLAKGKINVVIHRQGSFLVKEDVTAADGHFLAGVYRGNSGQRFPVPRPELLIAGDVPIAVLIDGKSASASEIFAGALKVNKRALVVGEKSMGKGEGQEVIDLPFGRRMTITTFEFRGGGVAHNLHGVEPDLYVPPGIAGGADAQLEAAINMLTAPAQK